MILENAPEIDDVHIPGGYRGVLLRYKRVRGFAKLFVFVGNASPDKDVIGSDFGKISCTNAIVINSQRNFFCLFDTNDSTL